jgi:hypothetical protein
MKAVGLITEEEWAFVLKYQCHKLMGNRLYNSGSGVSDVSCWNCKAVK